MGLNDTFGTFGDIRGNECLMYMDQNKAKNEVVIGKQCPLNEVIITITTLRSCAP